MQKAIVGIVPTWNNTTNRPFLNELSFINNYPKKIIEAGALARGILIPDGKFSEEELEGFDAFLFPGGSTIHNYHLLIMHYAITNDKPVLGICMGLQIMGAYDYIISQLKDKNIEVNYQTINDFYELHKDDETWFLKKVNNHDKESTFYDNSVINASHEVHIKGNTRLYDVYQTDTILEPSIHNFSLKNNLNYFIVNAVSPDGNIEGVEIIYPDRYVLGVQFHPELEEKNLILFQQFIEEALKRK